MKRLTLLVVVACLASTAKIRNTVQVEGDFIILAILGQSNAASYAVCPDVLPAVPDGIYNFGNDYVMHAAQEPIDSATNQIDTVSLDVINRCGSSITIAAELQRITGRQVVIVPCAKGGSRIAMWLPSYSRDTLYGSCLHRIQTVDAGGNHKVLIFFYQGESDVADGMDAVNAWVGRFNTVINALDVDLNYPPIVFAQMGPTGDPVTFPYMAELANLQPLAIAANVSMVKSEDLTLCDIIHLDYASQQIIGQRAALALYWLMKQK